jgi:hypothetical protein
MDKPRLLLVSELINAVNLLSEKVNEVEKMINKNTSVIILHSLFSYIVSFFEVTLSEILSHFLLIFPEKIESKSMEINKNDILLTDIKIRKKIIERYIHDISYKSIKDYFKIFINTLAIKNFAINDIEYMIEIKETRNLLLHNNLKLNDIYLSKAGKYSRATNEESYLLIDYKYFKNSISIMKNILTHLNNEICLKYSKYTKNNAYRSLWQYLFDSPVLIFDDIFNFNDNCIYLKIDKRKLRAMIKCNYSSTENIFLRILFEHYNSTLSLYLFKDMNFNHFALSISSKEKLLFLNNAILYNEEIFKY